MPTYRIYYSERDPGTAADAERYTSPIERLPGYGAPRDAIDETEWEEEIEAPSPDAALDAFFKEHVRDNSELMWIDERGESRAVEGLSYDTGKTYIWVEDGKLMEYQGLDEGTPGLVSCPLCGGAGEVTADVADQYVGEYGDDIVEQQRSEGH
jgi:hypothetical protein